jgi:protein-S-isoprenylcysteine O-methyltransferase Ste14
MKPFLLARAAFFVVLLPGTVAGYIPLRILRATGRFHVPGFSPSSCAAALILVAGGIILLRCVWDFFAAGEGTLAPIDAPKRLVVRGLYRFTRNPMYNGVIGILAGEAWLFHSLDLVDYALVVLVVFHLFVVIYEERALEARFGESYRDYRRLVPRWGFTIRAFGKRVE